MNYYKRALELKEETIANRRYLHEHAETGLHLENTVEFVMKQLTEYGLSQEKVSRFFCFVPIWMHFL